MRKGHRLPLVVLRPYLLDPDPGATAALGPLDWAAVFGNDRPVEIEVGFGKGGFLVQVAQDQPDRNFVGVEIDRGLELYVANRVAKRDLANVRLVRADARQWLRDQVPADSVAAVHVYFPDPWWKKRHKKRRVFTAEFAAECERALAPGGALHLATDVEEYFGVMTELVTSATRLRPVPPAVLFVGPDGRPRETNFERKAREQGRAVWRASYRRPGPPESPS